jgi:hypothetical protein
LSGLLNPNGGSSDTLNVGVSDWWEGELLWSRENIPLAIMGVVSLAVLFVFGLSEMMMRDVQPHLNGCSGSQQAATPIGWAGDASFPRAVSSPGFSPSLPSRISSQTGCTRSSTMVAG